MRALALIPVLFIAACGETQVADKAAAPAAAEAPSPGQWELSAEVTRFRQTDTGAPMINAPVGTRTTERFCVGAGELPAEMFAGEGYRCRRTSDYVHGGRLNLSLTCQRDGLSGNVLVTANGTFEEATMEFTRNLRTVLATNGDVEIDARVTGRRVGDCPAG